MYHFLVRLLARRNFELVNERDFDTLLAACTDDIHHRFGGDHALGGERHDKAALRLWFQRLVEADTGVAARRRNEARRVRQALEAQHELVVSTHARLTAWSQSHRSAAHLLAAARRRRPRRAGGCGASGENYRAYDATCCALRSIR